MLEQCQEAISLYFYLVNPIFSATLFLMNAWIFDVDGVLSNLVERQMTEPVLSSSLRKILEQGDLLAFNTGRGAEWVQERILKPLEEFGVNPSLLHDVFIAGEKGGAWQEADKELQIYESFVLPPLLLEKIKKLISDAFSDSMYFDESKRTMISIEMRKDFPIDVFSERQKQLHPVLTKYLEEFGLGNDYFVQDDLIAMDIIHKTAGKDMGMQHILTWLETTGKNPEHFYCFGDNPSDLHMGEVLQEQGFALTFIYVGTRPLHPTAFAPVITEEKFDKGTAEYLQKIM